MGGAGIVFTEATHVSAIGRITPYCLGLWNAQHQALLTRLAAIIARGGAVPGIQLAHAGRKASTTRTWEGSKPIAPAGRRLGAARRPAQSSFHPGAVDPHALTTTEIAGIAGQFAATARMAREAGIQGGGDPRRARLPAAFVPVADLQPSQRRLRRRPCWAQPLPDGDAGRGARANGPPICRCSCGCPAWTTCRAA